MTRIDELETALAAIERERPDALMPVQSFRFFSGAGPGSLSRLLEFATEHRSPQMYEDGNYVRAGGLMSLGTNDAERWRIVARQIDKILRGAYPGDLPVEFNSMYEIVLNLPAARKIGPP